VAISQTFITVVSGGIGGTYHPFGIAMAEMLSRSDIGVRANSRATSASRENCRLIASDQAQVGMTMGFVLWQAYNGIGVFEGYDDMDLLILMKLYSAPQHLITTTQTGIKRFEDIRGRRVSTGSRGGGDQLLTEKILEVAGINQFRDITRWQLTQLEAVMALKDGDIDAAFFNFATPGANILQLALTHEVVLIPIPDYIIETVCNQYPFLIPSMIPAGTYPSQKVDISTIADANYLVTNSNLPDQIAYDIVRLLIENRESFIRVTHYASNFTPKNVSVGITPFHPGAIKYFVGQGIDMERKDE